MTRPPTLAAYLATWLERRRWQVRPHTLAGDEMMTRRWVVPHLGERRLDELDRRLLEATYARLLARGGMDGRPLAPKSVRNVHTMLRSALRDAVELGLLDDNPVAAARPPRLDASATELGEDPQVWTGEQAAAFLTFVDDHPWRALWHLAVGTGARRGELLGLRWQDVDLDRGQVRIRRSLSVVRGDVRLLPTKSARPRVLCIAESVVEAMARHRRACLRQRARTSIPPGRWDLVFTGDDGAHLGPSRVSLAFVTLAVASPSPRIRFHDLRHTHASLLLALGVPMKVVSERLGHRTIRMTMDVYGHLLPGQDADAAARFEQLIGEA